MTDAFHQTSVTGDHEGVVREVVAISGGDLSFGNRHADRVGESLTEGTSRHFHASRVTSFRVTRCGRVPLPEGLEVFDFQSVAGEEEQCVLQDRCMTTRQDESVTREPVRSRRIVPEYSAIEHVPEGGKGHCGSLVSTLGLERGIQCDPTNDGDSERVSLGTQSWESRHGARLVARDGPGESGTDDDLERKVVIKQDDVGSRTAAKHATVVESEESSRSLGDHRQCICEGNSAPLGQVAHGCVKTRRRTLKTRGRAFVQESVIANLVGND